MNQDHPGPRLLVDAGLPPWSEITQQVCLRYATPAYVYPRSCPWVQSLVSRMIGGLADPLVDVRYWPCLQVGDEPGPTNWHVDDLRAGGGRNRLYFAGAGSWTEFEPGQPSPEGWIIEYTHAHVHRSRPARVPGPRLFVRASEADPRRVLDAVVPAPTIRGGKPV